MKTIKITSIITALLIILGALPLSADESGKYNSVVELPVISSDDIKQSKFTITFDPQGGHLFPTTAKTDENGRLSTLKAPTKYGFKFDGWYTEKEGGEKVTTDTVFTKNTTLYAHWSHGLSSTKNYTLTFDTDGGSSVAALSAAKGTLIDVDNFTTVRDGFVFDGWYSDKTLTTRIKTIQLNSDTEIYAGWKPISDTTPVIENPYTDISSEDSYFEAVLYAAEHGLMNGVGDGLFEPELPVTRGMLVTILWRIENCPEVTSNEQFNDVTAEHYGFEALKWGLENRLINGYGDGIYKLDGELTREQSTAILYRYADFKGIDTADNAGLLEAFADGKAVSDWARTSLGWAVANKLFGADAENRLTPGAAVKRSELAVLLYTLCEDVLK